MTHIFISPNGDYPRHIGDIQLDNPNWNGDQSNLPEGWKAVTPVEPPAILENQTAYEEAPKLIDGEYVQVWKVRDLTAKEVKALETFIDPNLPN